MSGLAARCWPGTNPRASTCGTAPSTSPTYATRVEHAGWGFGHVDGWTGAGTKAGFLAAVGEALDFPDYYGQNFDALADCLHDIGDAVATGVVLLWDGWATLARADEKAFSIALSVLGSRVNADRGVPFAVLLRGEGPEVRRASTEPRPEVASDRALGRGRGQLGEHAARVRRRWSAVPEGRDRALGQLRR